MPEKVEGYMTNRGLFFRTKEQARLSEAQDALESAEWGTIETMPQLLLFLEAYRGEVMEYCNALGELKNAVHKQVPPESEDEESIDPSGDGRNDTT
jgi:hypothetical protein